MKNLVNRIPTLLPFALLIFINFYGGRMLQNEGNLNVLKIVFIFVGIIAAGNILFIKSRKISSYFAVSISTAIFIGIICVFISSVLKSWFILNSIAILYLSLFLAAFIPPILGKDPFTYKFSKNEYPSAVQKMPLFKFINILLNYIWAFIFGIAAILSVIKFSNNQTVQQIIQNGLPSFIQIAIGLPLTILLPAIIMAKGSGKQLKFETVMDMFQAMPYGLNKKKAEGFNIVIQFELSGAEEIIGHLSIINNACTFNLGNHDNPTTCITADSILWLAISNGEVSGDEAYLNGAIKVSSDAALLLKLNDLFTSGSKIKKTKKSRKKTFHDKYNYSAIEPGKIKNILVINSVSRTRHYSKSLLMANKFIEGAQASGAEVKTIPLSGKKINNCIGCYNCWTKTPGICVFKDDMPDLLDSIKKTDLVVFITPLYFFSVSALLKQFIDRMLPLMTPYMESNNGLTYHPDRLETNSPKGLIVFAAGSFPEIENNFDGISAIFRNMTSHLKNTRLMGEFYLPASELLQQPVYAEKRSRIEDTCFASGSDAVQLGLINKEYMKAIADPEIEQQEFMDQANMFWKALEGKKTYNQGVPKLQIL